MIRTATTLAVLTVALATSVAQAEPQPSSWGPIDPPIAAAIQMHNPSAVDYGPLDPPIAAAIQMHGAVASPPATVSQVDSRSFAWSDFAVGAGAMLALVLCLASLRKVASMIRARQPHGL